MRSRLLLVAREATLRAGLAQLLGAAGYAVELAEGVAHARRFGGFKRFALALVDTEGLGAEGTALVGELQAAMPTLLVAAASGPPRPGSEMLNPTDKATLLARVAEALRPVPELHRPPTLRWWRRDCGGNGLIGSFPAM